MLERRLPASDGSEAVTGSRSTPAAAAAARDAAFVKCPNCIDAADGVFVSTSSCSPSSNSTPRSGGRRQERVGARVEEAANLRVTEFRRSFAAALAHARPQGSKRRRHHAALPPRRGARHGRPAERCSFFIRGVRAPRGFRVKADALANRVRADASTAAKSLVEDVFGEEEEADQRERRASRGPRARRRRSARRRRRRRAALRQVVENSRTASAGGKDADDDADSAGTRARAGATLVCSAPEGRMRSLCRKSGPETWRRSVAQCRVT